MYAYVQPDGTWWINNTGFVVGPRVSCASTPAPPSAGPGPSSTPWTPWPGPVGGPWSTPTTTGTTPTGTACSPSPPSSATSTAAEACSTPAILRPDGVFEPVDWGDLEPAAALRHLRTTGSTSTSTISWSSSTTSGRPAHTTNDVVAWIPERRVLFTGDLVFNGGTPFVLMGSVAGALDGPRPADRVRRRDPRPRPRPAVRARARSTRWASTSASSRTPPPTAVAAGISPLEAARQTRPRPLRRPDRPRTDRRQPPSRLRRVRRGPARRPHRHRRRLRRHDRLQRRSAPALPGLTPRDARHGPAPTGPSGRPAARER